MKYLVIFIIILIAFSVGGYMYNANNENGYDFKIYFFNAGKADCMLISNNGKYIMIDTGEENLSSEILAYIKNNNIAKLDYLIITHFDKDHVGSAANIINNIEVENVLQSNCPKESEYYTNYINALKEKGINAEIISGDVSFTLADMNIVVNGPTAIYDSNESNNSSLIISINYKNTNYLFTGDAQNDRIKDYIINHNSSYDFIKIPYHGHYQKRLDDLLEVVNPKYAVITSSAEEPEDEETTALLNEMNVKYYLTRSGSITVLSNGTEIRIKQ